MTWVWTSAVSKIISSKLNNSDTRHEKTDLKVFVVVIPKEGWARMADNDNDKELKVCFLVTRV